MKHDSEPKDLIGALATNDPAIISLYFDRDREAIARLQNIFTKNIFSEQTLKETLKFLRNQNALGDLAKFFFKKDEYREAEEHLQQAIEEFRDDISETENLLVDMQKNIAQAKADFANIIHLIINWLSSIVENSKLETKMPETFLERINKELCSFRASTRRIDELKEFIYSLRYKRYHQLLIHEVFLPDYWNSNGDFTKDVEYLRLQNEHIEADEELNNLHLKNIKWQEEINSLEQRKIQLDLKKEDMNENMWKIKIQVNELKDTRLKKFLEHEEMRTRTLSNCFKLVDDSVKDNNKGNESIKSNKIHLIEEICKETQNAVEEGFDKRISALEEEFLEMQKNIEEINLEVTKIVEKSRQRDFDIEKNGNEISQISDKKNRLKSSISKLEYKWAVWLEKRNSDIESYLKELEKKGLIFSEIRIKKLHCYYKNYMTEYGALAEKICEINIHMRRICGKITILVEQLLVEIEENDRFTPYSYFEYLVKYNKYHNLLDEDVMKNDSSDEIFKAILVHSFGPVFSMEMCDEIEELIKRFSSVRIIAEVIEDYSGIQREVMKKVKKEMTRLELKINELELKREKLMSPINEEEINQKIYKIKKKIIRIEDGYDESEDEGDEDSEILAEFQRKLKFEEKQYNIKTKSIDENLEIELREIEELFNKIKVDSTLDIDSIIAGTKELQSMRRSAYIYANQEKILEEENFRKLKGQLLHQIQDYKQYIQNKREKKKEIIKNKLKKANQQLEGHQKDLKEYLDNEEKKRHSALEEIESDIRKTKMQFERKEQEGKNFSLVLSRIRDIITSVREKMNLTVRKHLIQRLLANIIEILSNNF